MFHKGDWIIYGSSGVCKVEEIGTPAWSPVSGRLYYKLTPAFDIGTISIPVDTQVFMRPILTRQQALDLIARIPDICAEQECPCGSRELAGHYRAFFESHACEDLVQLIKTIYQKGRKLAGQGKKPSKTDQQFRKRAEQLLHSELAIALGVPLEEVPQFIQREIDAGKQQAAGGAVVEQM